MREGMTDTLNKKVIEKMETIRPIEFVCPVITESNYREAIRQNRIASIKKLYPKTNFSSIRVKKEIQKYVDKRILSVIKYGSSFGTSFFNIHNRIFLNLKLIHDDFNDSIEDSRLTFEQKICETISHEIIHIVLDDIEGNLVSHKYDNIKDDLRKNGFRGC
jgi:hypothetical protein